MWLQDPFLLMTGILLLLNNPASLHKWLTLLPGTEGSFELDQMCLERHLGDSARDKIS